MRIWILFIALGLLMWGCSKADTLADKPPVEVTIQGQPTFQNGIGKLLEVKCAYCHAVPKPDIAPDTVPPDLDLTHYETRVVNNQVIRGADAIGRYIFDGILEGEVAQYASSFEPQTTENLRQMPLDYGTQLTSAEIVNLELWSNTGSSLDGSPQPNDGDSTRGSAIWFQDGCVGCHDLGNGIVFDGQVIGPAIRPAALTIAKIKMMYLYRIGGQPLSDEDAAAVRAFLLPFLEDN